MSPADADSSVDRLSPNPETADPSASARASLFLWRGQALVVCPGIDSRPHDHFATQISFGLDGPFRARSGPEDAWVATRSAVFAANRPHQLDCGGILMAHLFVERRIGRPGAETLLPAGFENHPSFAPVSAALRAARCGTLSIDDAGLAVERWLACLDASAPSASGSAGFDPRIARALDWIAAHPGEDIDGARLAGQVHLSESRFTHLFRQQTGLSLSRYLLWSRLLDGVEALAMHGSLTQAAHAAGFADLAHMSRTFSRTFGVVASELQKMTIAFKRGAR